MSDNQNVAVETLVQDAQNVPVPKEKQVKNKELIIFLTSVFFYTMITGMVGSYRQEYLTTFVGAKILTEDHISTINSIVSIVGYFISFAMALVIDRSRSKIGKFRPLIMIVSLPLAVVTSLSFYLPGFLSDSATKIMIYFCILFIIYGGLTNVGNSVNLVAMVMSSDDKERNSVMSWRSIVSAVGNSAPLVVVLVVGMLRKPGIIKNDEIMYLVSAILCSVIGMITMLLGAKVIRERTTYDRKSENPLKNIKSIVTNKHAILVIISEFLKSFRGLASYM
ncbi:MAG: MFS transporter, partial [Clostridia bacterium]|nr:MFS transporter [Clostridia bacterium]